MELLTNLVSTLIISSAAEASIAKVPEASGICYIEKTKKLIVVNDEGWIYRLSTNGKILEKKYLGKYDLEGVTYDAKNDRLLLAREDKNSILIVKRENFKIEKEISIKKKFQKKTILEKSKDGIEAITIIDDDVYVAKQPPLSSSKKYVLIRLKNLKKKQAKIKEIYIHSYPDIAGLCYYKNNLYMVSDTKNLLIKYDLQTNKTLQKIKLPSSAQEGICFDEEHLYIADDNGHVLKYTIKELGIQ